MGAEPLVIAASLELVVELGEAAPASAGIDEEGVDEGDDESVGLALLGFGVGAD